VTSSITVFEGEISVYGKLIIGKLKENDSIDGNERKFYLNFHLQDVFVVEFTAYEGEMIKEVALTSFTSHLHDACHNFVPVINQGPDFRKIVKSS